MRLAKFERREGEEYLASWLFEANGHVHIPCHGTDGKAAVLPLFLFLGTITVICVKRVWRRVQRAFRMQNREKFPI